MKRDYSKRIREQPQEKPPNKLSYFLRRWGG